MCELLTQVANRWAMNSRERRWKWGEKQPGKVRMSILFLLTYSSVRKGGTFVYVCMNSLFPESIPLPSRGIAPCPSSNTQTETQVPGVAQGLKHKTSSNSLEVKGIFSSLQGQKFKLQ